MKDPRVELVAAMDSLKNSAKESVLVVQMGYTHLGKTHAIKA